MITHKKGGGERDYSGTSGSELWRGITEERLYFTSFISTERQFLFPESSTRQCSHTDEFRLEIPTGM